MKNTVNGLFRSKSQAADTIEMIQKEGYAKDISILAKNRRDGSTKTTDVQKDISEGTLTGVATGAAFGALAAIATGATTAILPGLGPVLLAGPLYAGLAGAATGAVTGGAIGALVEMGVPEETALLYEQSIGNGEVLVSVSVSANHVEDTVRIFSKQGASSIRFDTR